MRGSKPIETVPMEITVETLKAKIYMVRGQRVMLAADLAEIYGYTTKAFNQQVKNNMAKFDEDFRFQMTRAELDDLVRSKKLTSREESVFQGQSGASSKDAGNKITTISKADNKKLYYPMIEDLLRQPVLHLQ